MTKRTKKSGLEVKTSQFKRGQSDAEKDIPPRETSTSYLRGYADNYRPAIPIQGSIRGLVYMRI